MAKQPTSGISRREFTKSTTLGLAGLAAAPAVVTAQRTDTATPMVGEGEHVFQADHNWCQLPDKYHWQITHNVAVGSDGMVYVTHEGKFDLEDHPSIFVFDADGKFVRAFGEQFQGGGHGIEVRNENGEDFLYVSCYQRQRSIAKLNAKGEQLWRQGAPIESGLYADNENVFPVPADKQNAWGRNRFMPTNIAFHPEEGFFVADGYGAWCVHYYNNDGKYQRTFGEPSGKDKADGTFALPHGIWIDDRGDAPLVVIADRANARVQWFDLEGQHVRTQGDFLLPANMDVRGDVLLVPDLVARVTLLDKQNNIVAQLGKDTERIQQDQKDTGGFTIRTKESQWLPGKFVHPHDACFDADGNIYVAEWVATGRVTKLTKMV